MIHQMWPYIGDYVKKVLKDTVQPIVDNSLPGSLKPFKFEQIDLGDVVTLYCIIAALNTMGNLAGGC